MQRPRGLMDIQSPHLLPRWHLLQVVLTPGPGPTPSEWPRPRQWLDRDTQNQGCPELFCLAGSQVSAHIPLKSKTRSELEAGRSRHRPGRDRETGRGPARRGQGLGGESPQPATGKPVLSVSLVLRAAALTGSPVSSRAANVSCMSPGHSVTGAGPCSQTGMGPTNIRPVPS